MGRARRRAVVLFGSVRRPTCRGSTRTRRTTSRPRSCRATPSRRRRWRSPSELQGGEQAPIVIVYRREGGLTDGRPARIQSDRDRAQPGDRGEQGRHLPRGLAPFGEPVPSESGRRGAADRQHHGRRRGRHDPRPGRRHPRPRERPRRRARGQGHRAGAGFAADAIKVFESINGTLLGAALAARRRAADPDLPQPDLPLDPAVRGRRSRRSRRARSATGSPRSASPSTGSRRRSSRSSCSARAPTTRCCSSSRYREELRKHEDKHEAMALALRTRRPGDRRVRRDGHRARCCASRSPRSSGTAGPRPDRRARHRRRDGHDAHRPAGAARRSAAGARSGGRHVRLTTAPALRRRGRGRDARRLAARGRARRARPAPRLDRHRSRCSSSARSACSRSTRA